MTATQRTAQLRYIKRLIAWKNTQTAALRGEELIRDLREIDASEGKDVAGELAACKAQVAKRTEAIAEINAQIAEARAKLA